MVNYFLIPHFVQKALGRHNLPLSSFTDFNKMREFLSINDIVLTQTLQTHKYWKILLGINAVEDKDFFYAREIGLYSLWYNSATEENKTYLVNILSVLVESGQANDEIVERLFNKRDTVDANNNSDGDIANVVILDPYSYEIQDIGPKCYGIIVGPNAFPNLDFSNKLIKDILKSMYIYCSQSEIARTELFKLYMGRL